MQPFPGVLWYYTLNAYDELRAKTVGDGGTGQTVARQIHSTRSPGFCAAHGVCKLYSYRK